MAKAAGGIAGTLSGTIGGTTFSKDGRVRNKSNPSNKATQSQDNQRGLLTEISQIWRTLTEADRLAWLSVGAGFSITNVFGAALNLKGNALFQKLNQNLAQIGSPYIDVPPNPAGGGSAPTFGAVAASVGGGTFTAAFTPSPQPAGFAVELWATVGKSAGVRFVESSYKLIYIIQPTDTTPADIFTAYVETFGSLIEGSTITLSMQSVNIATGETGSIQTTTVIVAP